MAMTIEPPNYNDASWSSAFSGLAAALGSGFLVQGITWIRARKKARKAEIDAEIDGRSDIIIHKLDKDESANQRLVTFLEQTLSQVRVDLEEVTRERDALQERNRSLAQRWAIQDTNVRILMATITAGKLPMPFLVNVPSVDDRRTEDRADD
jgi:hypothetical protein